MTIGKLEEAGSILTRKNLRNAFPGVIETKKSSITMLDNFLRIMDYDVLSLCQILKKKLKSNESKQSERGWYLFRIRIVNFHLFSQTSSATLLPETRQNPAPM